MAQAPLILWFRRDLRLADNPMLQAALATGRPLIPVFILDPETEALGAAPTFRLGLAIEAFAAALADLGARLILRRGPADEILKGLVAGTGAAGVLWSRLYDPASKARDVAVKAALKDAGRIAESHPGHLLHEPWEVTTGQGGFYKVFTPFWRAIRSRDVPLPSAAPASWPAPAAWPESDTLPGWHMARAMGRGAPVVARYQHPGEAAARDRLADFLASRIDAYAARRDDLAANATSGLSEHLACGEIGIRQIWHAALRRLHKGSPGAESFLKELAWREFAWHLLHHTPHIATANWKPGWDNFPWRPDNPDAEAWRRGMTGEPLIDAAMREMYVTGRMHNRARMIAASYLTKHLLTDWRVGLAWFAECLTDWDPASNALGWQWVAGCGPDAAPFFRIFNPATQAATHDVHGHYRHRWLAEAQHSGEECAADFFRAAPLSWQLDSARPPERPLIDLSAGRERALSAYRERNA